MKIIVDESVSFGVVGFLRNAGYEVTGIMEKLTSGLEGKDVFDLVKNYKAVLITRDHYFTNSLRFPPTVVACIIYIRKGNLTSTEEIDLINWFFDSYAISDFKGRLVTISPDHIKVR
jgi:predicted nuclease of predicted toxin-antitoxin system